MMGNGFAFSASISADGTEITLVANKDDHEGRFNHVFRMSPESATELVELIRGSCATAKQRRKAIGKAAKVEGQ